MRDDDLLCPLAPKHKSSSRIDSIQGETERRVDGYYPLLIMMDHSKTPPFIRLPSRQSFDGNGLYNYAQDVGLHSRFFDVNY